MGNKIKRWLDNNAPKSSLLWAQQYYYGAKNMHIAMAHCSTKADRLSAKQASSSRLCTFFYIIVYNLQRNNSSPYAKQLKNAPSKFLSAIIYANLCTIVYKNVDN